MPRPVRTAMLLAAAALVLSACGGDPAEPTETSSSGGAEKSALRPLTFMAGYAPQANLPFVGAYVAQAEGFFADEGLDVTIQHSAGGGEHLQLLANGTVDITTQDAGVVLERRADPGLPLVSIALVGQRGQQAYVALEESGIETPKDWEGRTVGYKGTPPPDLFAIMAAEGVDPGAVELVNVGFDPRLLTAGQVDVFPVFKSNEPDTIEGWGYDLVSWDAADYGVPTLGLTYVATEETVADDPELLRSFLAAVMRGVAFAEDDPQRAVEIVVDVVGDDAVADHQRFMLETELVDAHSAVTDEHGLGWQTTEQWQALADLLVEQGVVDGPVDATEAFTTDLLPSG